MKNDELQPNRDGEGKESLSPENQQRLVDVLSNALLQAVQKPPEKKEETKEMEIDLVELFFGVLSKIHYIIIVALIGAIIMGMNASKAIPMYSATSKLYIVGNQGTALNVSDLQMGSMLTMDYEEVFRTWEVHEMVRSQLGLNYSYGQMQGMLSISNPEDTRVLLITVRNPDAQLAADLANAYATAAKTFILQTMDSEEPNVFSVALVPSVASRVSKATEAAKGFLIGGVLMTGLIVLFFILDDRPRTPEHIQKAADIPTLAIIPAVSKEEMKKAKRVHHRALS
ncbi:MAG: hypothetical protein IJ392_04810 [Clostridia bacterium]|nr:hypothetical protein [Clostridia bacterium]